MYIGISGTHGSGKSTILYKIASKCKKNGINISIIEERARLCPFPINKDATLESQLWMVTDQIKCELKRKNKFDVILSDRTLVDVFAYGLDVLSHKSPEDAFVFKKLWEGCRHIISNTYDLIIIPNHINFNFLIDDGIRDTDEEFRDDIFTTIVELYKDVNVDKLAIWTPGSLDSFVDKLIDEIIIKLGK